MPGYSGLMMELPEMLAELRDMVEDEEIENINCDHSDPARPEAYGTPEFCAICFINNLSENASDQEPYFTEETTDRQRETIQSLWDQWCDS